MGFISSSTVGRSERGEKLKQQPKILCKLLNLVSNTTKITFSLIDVANRTAHTIIPVSPYMLVCTKKIFDIYIWNIYLHILSLFLYIHTHIKYMCMGVSTNTHTHTHANYIFSWSQNTVLYLKNNFSICSWKSVKKVKVLNWFLNLVKAY